MSSLGQLRVMLPSRTSFLSSAVDSATYYPLTHAAQVH